MWWIAGLGGVLASFVLLFKTLPGVLQAHRTGVIVGKGYGAPRIERAVDPERFRALLATRTRALSVPAIVFAVSVAWLAYNYVGILMMT